MATSEERLGQEVKKRADFVLSSGALPGGGGLLPVTKAREFMVQVVNVANLLPKVRVVEMPTPQYTVSKLDLGEDIIRADPGDATAMASGSRVAPTATDMTLTSKHHQVVVKLGLRALENVLNQDAFVTTLMDAIASSMAPNLESIALESDTTLGTSTPRLAARSQQDGWLKLITSNVVNFSNAELTEARLNSVRRTIALKYIQRGGYEYYVQQYAGDRWREQVAQGVTSVAERAMVTSELPPHAGSKVLQLGTMPVAAGSPDVAPMLFCNPKNLVLGWFQHVKINTEVVYRENAFYVIIDFDVAFQVEWEAAAAKGTNVRAEA